MKKYAPLIVTAVVLIALAAFFLVKETSVAPVIPSEATSTGSTATTTPGIGMPAAGGSPVIPGVPAGAVVHRVYDNKDWDIKLSFDPSWEMSDSGTLVTVDAPSTRFIVGQGAAFAEPARGNYVSVKHEVLGEKVTAHRYANPNEEYAFYDYFSVRAGGETYYFNVRSKTMSNAELDAFLAGITKK